MSKVKHTMEANGTTVCGRTISENGQGADCKQCAARVARNAERVAAMVPSGNGLVEVEAITGDVIEVTPADITGAEVETARRFIRQNGRVFAREVHNFGGQAAFDALVASGWANLINDGDMSRYVRGETVIGRRAWGPNGLQGTIESTYSDGSVNLVTFGESNIIPAGQWKLMKATPTPTVDDVAAMADTENWFNKIVELSEQTVKAEIEESTPPAIPGYYWMRHNGHTSVENGPTVRTTDTYQLCRAGDRRVLATISHKAGFRWVPSGCWFISTLLCESWGGVPLADAFDRIKTYVRECEWAYTGDHYARMSAGDNARKGQPFTSREDIRADVAAAIEASGEIECAGDDFDVDGIVNTIIAYYGRVPVGQVPTAEFWLIVQRNALPAAVMAVGAIKAPIRTAMGRRARKALSRKHKPSKARVR